MAIDSTKRPSALHDSDFQILLSETLTTFLTTLFGKRRSSFFEKCREVILYLLEARGNEGYPAQIAAHYGHGRKRYQDIIQSLEDEGFITLLPKISNYRPILLNDNVRVYLNKIVGGLAKNANLRPPAPKEQTNLSGFSLTNSDMRAHYINSTFLHNLSSRRFQKLKGKWSHHHSRCTIFEKSDNISDNKLYTIQWFKDKLMIFSPVEFISIEHASKVKDRVAVQMGSFAKHLEKKYHVELKFLENVILEKNHQEYQVGQAQVLSGVEEIKQQRELTLDVEDRNIRRDEKIVSALGKMSGILENLLVFSENLATKEDVERVIEQLQHVNPGSSSRTQEVIELLESGPKTLAQLAAAMKITKPGVKYYLDQLNVESPGTKKLLGRGRPQKLWRMKENE